MHSVPLFDHIMVPEQVRRWGKGLIPEQVRKVIGQLDKKPVGRALAESFGLKVPRLYQMNIGLFDALALANSHTDTEFVVKPVHGKNSWCVLLLRRTDHGVFFDVMAQRERSIEELCTETYKSYVKRRIGVASNTVNLWMVEQLLIPSPESFVPIDDFKFYAFYGEVALILHKRNFFVDGKWSSLYRWYDSSWNPIGTGKYDDKLGLEMRPPANSDSLMQAAVSTSLKLLAPFSRIDLYLSCGAVYFGEFTMLPGNPRGFDDETNSRLGLCWTSAEDRLIQDVKGGAIPVELYECYEKGLVDGWRNLRV
ncbi:ATP-grasp fold amidoligase family protein [Bordetella sp. 15P40C-2]|uniref:ATP-grasp fold amidoligase family protein n=1 Tax=Bordetella sp. 15P40C-2 TaxID=2572246 RepID=UPI001323810C|nr:ATP-grasp fold amidoligase family protein [Bordetella sp. 15P40C-2]MVW73291.1 hypothetical protein [Bordetella sp. 15P40C-2]